MTPAWQAPVAGVSQVCAAGGGELAVTLISGGVVPSLRGL